MPSIFTKIINGEIPCYKIAETENCFAFLDIAPLAKGHTLVITKKEIEYIFNVQDELLADLTIFSKKIAKAIEKAVPCKRIGVAVIGIEVPHTHIHLVPLNSIGDLDFSRTKLKPSEEELKLVQSEICRYL